ncbi:FAD-binding oxidoreductase [Bacilliculturomica massiliensis]|uniref:FAD-binding oxidoreductase n=1 Tax=Bacilliculturomica massiliensis TaxID=1917867 RepID=UPI0010309656|nr:FAD-binding oxidoreductase [Bacilliculturomica massiliensis]
MKADITARLEEIAGREFVVYDQGHIEDYLYDETERRLRPPACRDCVVVKPGKPEEISEILKLANSENITAVVRGGGTGLCGAAIPVRPSIIISMERFKKILEYDDKNFVITVEAGVTLREMNEFLQERNVLYFPCHPGGAEAQVGGLAMENAGDPRAVKHGVMRNHIKGLEVVTPTGALIRLGGKLRKNNAGYDLMQLMIGSEGTLGVVTKVMLRLYPKTKYSGVLLASFDTCGRAADAVTRTLKRGIVPLSIEYLNRSVALRTAEYVGERWPLEKGRSDLLFIAEEDSEEGLFDVQKAIEEICSEAGAVESLVPEAGRDQSVILTICDSAYGAFGEDLTDSMDIAVPPADIPRLISGLEQIAERYGAAIDTVGHMGDGNVHSNVYLAEKDIDDYYEDLKRELYALTVRIGGTITGEYGIGKIRRDSLPVQYDSTQLRLMRGIKELFDPNGILNPDTAIY